jgi:hypothetical protein
MATELPTHSNGTTLNGADSNGNGNVNSQAVKEGLARMLKGGVIMDVVNAEQVFLALPCLSSSLVSSSLLENLFSWDLYLEFT